MTEEIKLTESDLSNGSRIMFSQRHCTLEEIETKLTEAAIKGDPRTRLTTLLTRDFIVAMAKNFDNAGLETSELSVATTMAISSAIIFILGGSIHRGKEAVYANHIGDLTANLLKDGFKHFAETRPE